MAGSELVRESLDSLDSLDFTAILDVDAQNSFTHSHSLVRSPSVSHSNNNNNANAVRHTLIIIRNIIIITIIAFARGPQPEYAQKLFEASRSTEGALQMAAGPNHSIFTGSRATARIASYLQCRRPRGGIIPYKNEGILFREASAERRSEDGTFSPSWGVPWGPPRPPKEVLKIRGGHQSSRQLESLHFYSVP